MSQKIIHLDSQILNTLEMCELKTKYQFIDNLGFVILPEPLAKGDLLHQMLAKYYELRAINTDHEVCCHEAVMIGRKVAIDSSLPDEVINETIYQCTEYFDFYRFESWKPLFVEKSFSVPIFDSPLVKILYEGRIDLVADIPEAGITIVDHKSSSRNYPTSSLSNQFKGYCHALGLKRLIVNKIGFQKSLDRKDRFQRLVIGYEETRLEEWRIKAIYRAFKLLHCLETGYWPQNETSCDKYNGCMFQGVCTTRPELRDWKIERDFIVREPWNPAGNLEAKENEQLQST